MAELKIEELSPETTSTKPSYSKDDERIENISPETIITPDYSYGFSQNTMNYDTALRNKPVNPVFGDGTDGILIIENGQTVTLSPWAYNYRRLEVKTGGILTGNAAGTYVLKSSAETKIDGTVDFSGIAYAYSSASTVSTAYGTLTTGATGQWGAGKSDWATGSELTNGWAAANGYGGGGGGGAVYVAPTHWLGGNWFTGWDGGSSAGATSNTYLNKTTETAAHNGWAASAAGGGGEGAWVWSGGTFTVGSTGSGGYSDQWANGTAGWDAFLSGASAGFIGISGGGGGGGSLGANGANLVCYFNNLSGSGTITCAGDNGFNGGNGWAGASYGWSYGRTGAGGGGGGGGAGGALAVYYSGDVASITTTNTAGAGWSAGSGGSTNTGTQSAGFSGTAGTKTVVNINGL